MKRLLVVAFLSCASSVLLPQAPCLKIGSMPPQDIGSCA